MIFNFFLLITHFLIIFWHLQSLPSFIPFWYSREWGGQQLAPSAFIFFIPLIVFFIIISNFFLTEVFLKKNLKIPSILIQSLGIFLNLFLSFSSWRIITLFVVPFSQISSFFQKIFLAIISSFTLGIILTYLNILVAQKYKLFDKRHGPYQEVRKLSRTGGMSIFLVFLFLTLAFFPLEKHLLGLLLASFFIIVLGLLDDLFLIPPKFSPLIQGITWLLAVLIIIGTGIGINFVTNPLMIFGGAKLFFLDLIKIPIITVNNVTYFFTVLADLFTILWVFGAINFVNWLDGLDGLATGISFLAFLTTLFLSIKFHTPETAVLSAILLGATLSFLIFNFPRAKILLGSGAPLLGFLIAVLAIYSGGKVATAILVLAVPILDSLFVIYKRLKARGNIFRGDTTHLHHRLLQKGWTEMQIVLGEWIFCAALAALALWLKGSEKFIAIVVVFSVVAFFLKLKTGAKSDRIIASNYDFNKDGKGN